MHMLNKMCCVHYVMKDSNQWLTKSVPTQDSVDAASLLYNVLRLVLQSDWLFAFIYKKQTCYTMFHLKYNIIKWKKLIYLLNFRYLTDGDKTVTFP